ncbi:MAG: hypothetical protein JJU36_15185 [Phycisphaeraceae bacterium]|nr:hypothetical protein [Phycisphaeraceae bacterium]
MRKPFVHRVSSVPGLVPACLLIFALLASGPVSPVRAEVPPTQEPGVNGQAQTASEDATVSLRPRFIAGQSSRFELWNQVHVNKTLDVQGRTRTVEIRANTTALLNWDVQAVEPDGSAQGELTVQWMRVEVTDPEGQVSRNDSREGSGDTEAFHRALGVLAGSRVTVNIHADGSVRDVRGIDAIEQRLAGLEGDIELRSLFDFNEVAASLCTVPDAPESIESGQGWSHTRDQRQATGTVTRNVNFSLSGTETIAQIPVAMVNGEGTLTLEPDAQRLAETPGLAIRMTAGQYNTQIMMDLQRGEVVGRNANARMTIETVRQLGEAELTMTDQITSQTQLLRVAETEPAP